MRVGRPRRFLSSGLVAFGILAGLPAGLMHAQIRTAATVGSMSLTIDGTAVGGVRSMQGGTARAEVQSFLADGGVRTKLISAVNLEDVILEVGPVRPVMDWIAVSWAGSTSQTGTPPRKDVSVTAMGTDGKPFPAREFRNSLLTETTFSALDASSPSPLTITLRLKPGLSQPSSSASASQAPKTTASTVSFRVELDGRELTGVTRIDPFTVRQPLLESVSGGDKVVVPSGPVEFPNLKLTLLEPVSQEWTQWHGQLLPGMTASQGTQLTRKNGAIRVVDSVGKEMLKVNLHSCGILALSPRLEVSSAGARTTAELFCERMELVQP